MSPDLQSPLVPSFPSARKAAFLWLVFLTGVAPWLVAWLASEKILPLKPVTMVAILFVLGLHQIASAFLYFDKPARGVINNNKYVFYVVPLVALVVLPIALALYMQSHLEYIFIAHALIAIHHYQKQNLGIFSLVSPVISGIPVSSFERALLYAAMIPGMLMFSYPGFFEQASAVSGDRWVMFCVSAALVLFAVVFLCSCLSMAWVYRKLPWRAWLVRGLFFLMFSNYFWPMIFIENRFWAVVAAIASHNLHYYIMLAFIADQDGREWFAPALKRMASGKVASVMAGLAGVLLFAVFVWLASLVWVHFENLMGSKTPVLWDRGLLGGLAGGVILAFSWIHFHVDARLWRMQYQDSAAFVKQRFSFLWTDRVA